MLLRGSTLLLVTLALAGCAGSGPEKNVPVEDDLAARFAYPVGTAELEEGSGRERDGIGTYRVGIGLPDGARIPGYVVRPLDLDEEDDPAGVVFVHGAGGGADDFLREGHELAQRGAVVLTTDSPYVRSTDEALRGGEAALQDTYDAMAQWVREVRIALDLLVDRYGADPDRLAVVGYSMGAQPATIAAALDPRVQALVVMAGQAYPAGLPDDLLARRLFTAIDTEGFVDNLAPTDVLFQGAEFDSVVPRHEMEVLYEHASKPKQIRWYDADHELGQVAATERVEWLAEELQLEG